MLVPVPFFVNMYKLYMEQVAAENSGFDDSISPSKENHNVLRIN